MHVASTSGFPVSYPYTLILDPDTASEELVDVTAASGLALTVTRGVDGTAAVQHSFGAPVKHGVSARDYTDLQAHIAATVGVHGLTGSPVGTSDTQTLTNKTLASPTITSPTITGGTFTSTHAATSHTPTLNNITIGNGTTSASYQQVGPLIVYVFTLTYGSTTSFGAGQFFLSGIPNNTVTSTGATAVVETTGGIWTLDVAAGWQGTALYTGLTSSTRTWAAGDTLSITAIGFAA